MALDGLTSAIGQFSDSAGSGDSDSTGTQGFADGIGLWVPDVTRADSHIPTAMEDGRHRIKNGQHVCTVMVKS